MNQFLRVAIFSISISMSFVTCKNDKTNEPTQVTTHGEVKPVIE